MEVPSCWGELRRRMKDCGASASEIRGARLGFAVGRFAAAYALGEAAGPGECNEAMERSWGRYHPLAFDDAARELDRFEEGG